MQKAADAIHTQFLEYVQYLRSVVEENVYPNGENSTEQTEARRPTKRRKVCRSSNTI